MKNNGLEKTKKFWSDGFVAKLYRNYAGKLFLKLYNAVFEIVKKNKPKNILDIACGSANFLEIVSKKYPEIKLFGTDISSKMVVFARKKLGNKAEIVEASAGFENFQDQKFDMITIMLSFHHFPERQKLLEKYKSMLSDNGIIIIADIIPKKIFQARFWQFCEKIFGFRGYISFYSINDLKNIAKESGLKFEIDFIKGMANRYKIAILKK